MNLMNSRESMNSSVESDSNSLALYDFYLLLLEGRVHTHEGMMPYWARRGQMTALWSWFFLCTFL